MPINILQYCNDEREEFFRIALSEFYKVQYTSTVSHDSLEGRDKPCCLGKFSSGIQTPKHG